MIDTEKRNEKTIHIDQMTTAEMIGVMSESDFIAVNAVKDASKSIADAVDKIFPRMKAGGRLFYIGAGTSGRLGVLDASECPPTYGVDKGLVVGIISGGDTALRNAVENAEDSSERGVADLQERALCGNDSVVGISASGNCNYVCSALKYAESLGCVTVSVTSNPDAKMNDFAACKIVTQTGAEVITGSTRMNAGTAQKLVLNKLSTALMIKLGYVYENLMINLKPTNLKLKDRMVRIVVELSGASCDAALRALEQNGFNIRNAVAYCKDKWQ